MPKSGSDTIVEEWTEYDFRGTHIFAIYEDEDGYRYKECIGYESSNDLLGFEDDDHFEDNML